jgi:hypothetical protein
MVMEGAAPGLIPSAPKDSPGGLPAGLFRCLDLRSLLAAAAESLKLTDIVDLTLFRLMLDSCFG